MLNIEQVQVTNGPKTALKLSHTDTAMVSSRTHGAALLLLGTYPSIFLLLAQLLKKLPSHLQYGKENITVNNTSCSVIWAQVIPAILAQVCHLEQYLQACTQGPHCIIIKYFSYGTEKRTGGRAT